MEILLQRLGEMAKKGEETSQEANPILMKIVESIRSVATHMGEIAVAGMEQTQGVKFVNEKVAGIHSLSQNNADLVEKSSRAAGELAQHTDPLKASLKRVQLEAKG